MSRAGQRRVHWVGEKKEEESKLVFVQHFPCARIGEDVFPELGLALRCPTMCPFVSLSQWSVL